MKREKEYYENVVNGEIYKHYGLFCWQECFFCNQEFRRENGYRFQMQVNRDWMYSCSTCSTSKEHINNNVKAFYTNRPKAPAAPPKKR